MIRVALAGNPNSGKTTLFNSLTGSSAHVGNWPGVTVDKKEGVYKKSSKPISIIDLPGIYSLSPYTPEEVIARNYIIDEKPDCIINIVDATNLERNLYLTSQLLEMDVNVVIALNMIDVLEKNKDKIDIKGLEKEIGVPVVAISALKEENLQFLMEEVERVSSFKRKGDSILKKCKIFPIIEEIKKQLDTDNIESSLFHAVKLIENDEIEIKMHPKQYEYVLKEKETINDPIFDNDLEAIVADYRYKYIQKHFSSKLQRSSHVVTVIDKKSGVEITKKKETISDKIDKVLTNRVFGILFFVIILFFVFHFTFGEDLFYLKAMGVFNSLDPDFAIGQGTTFEGILFSSGTGIQSLGVFLQTIVIGFTDWINELINTGLTLAGASNWSIAFICDGLLAGVFSVLSFLPQILLLFLFFSILEDSGYMARVAFILDRLFRRFGVSGRAFMPMIMGFGCSIPAMTNTRTLATERERIATVRVIPFFSCSAKLPILTACSGAIVCMFGIPNADLITLSMYFTGIIIAILALLVMRNTTLRGQTPPFIMELPTYHLPQFKSLMIHLWDKAKHFIKKAFTIILISNIVIWFLQSFTPSWQYIEYVEEEGFLTNLTTNDSILAQIGKILQPIFTPLGFGVQLGSFGWVFAVAAITGLIAKENVIATFAMLGAVVSTSIDPSTLPSTLQSFEGSYDVAMMIQATNINIPGILAFIVFNMTTIPCFAAVATAKAELKKGTLKYTIIFWLITSFIVSSAFYLIGTWWWTLFIYLALIIVSVLIIYFYNKKHPIKEDISIC